ncbi:MAG: hypothetical protein COU06_02930 [Candidatus Harrisonbacteria bacterium CG10_big_fil_rev_8_21_14_0_10_38_8]|uniref:DoxX family protein n=1 Tax=Candidatus Harrisonbacteria bacterium CG10_big_fil_rev_8_21_14_0_10_38_8 TaxID=1974582 RepID=A0A2M6WJC9_9BACT|nr:MAG: hypothetical protein COU06_02930 [Candidatus Harrisonbacteria bacterium CG10_big_fil_rev_8_21_14_0_10_38_8]
MNKLERVFWGVLRIFMGWIFFWAFIDKVWGLGFTTAPEKSWLSGGSPTAGFLSFATKGPFGDIFKSLAGNPIVDWLFMVGLLFIGLCLMLGVGVKLASYSGVAMLLLMYLAGFIPPEHNPVLDDHIIYSVVLLGFPLYNAGRFWGLGEWWQNTTLVRKYKLLA